MAKRKTILIIEVALLSDDRVLEFWNRILQPVLRYKRREARRNAKNVVK